MSEAGTVGKLTTAVVDFVAASFCHPLEFLKHLVRQGTAFRRSYHEQANGIDSGHHALLAARLRLFSTSPPAALLEQRSIDEICPANPTESAWRPERGDRSELPEIEQRTLVRILEHHKPNSIFEIGTYQGRTTRLLATNAPGGTVHTLDLSPDDMLAGGCFEQPNEDLIGKAFRTSPSLPARIIQHFGDSRVFDFSPFFGKMDLVFVDASHAYEAVLSDSLQAFKLISDSGIIVWDDYDPIHGLGVMRALAEIARHKSVLWIKGTRFCVHDPALKVKN